MGFTTHHKMIKQEALGPLMETLGLGLKQEYIKHLITKTLCLFTHTATPRHLHHLYRRVATMVHVSFYRNCKSQLSLPIQLLYRFCI